MQARNMKRFLKKIRNFGKFDLNLAFHELGLELPKAARRDTIKVGIIGIPSTASL